MSHRKPKPTTQIGAVTWWGSAASGYKAEHRVVTVAKVWHAAAGEAEGGLGALARFMAGAHGIDLGPPSPAGWYWIAARRGVWTRPALAESAEAAMHAASRYVETAEAAA